MTDDEMIVLMQERMVDERLFEKTDIDRLIALARIGVRVTKLPREIYGAANAIANFDGEE